jgi:hypothetical protein
MNEGLNALEKATIQHVIALHSRVDALAGLVTLLATNQGADGQAVNALLQSLETASRQKRYEELEKTSPSHAAELSGQAELSDECLRLLSQLEFDRDED